MWNTIYSIFYLSFKFSSIEGAKCIKRLGIYIDTNRMKKVDK